MSFGTYEKFEEEYDDRVRQAKDKKAWKNFIDGSLQLNYNKVNNITVVMDDKRIGGTKGRYLYDIIDISYDQYVCVCTHHGSDQITLGATIQKMISLGHLRKSAVVFTFDYRKQGLDRVPYVKLGMKLYNVQYITDKKWTTMEHLISAAKEYCMDIPLDDKHKPENEIVRKLFIPPGLAIAGMKESLCAFGGYIKKNFGEHDECWTAIGTGTLTRAMQDAGVAKKYVMVSTDGIVREMKTGENEEIILVNQPPWQIPNKEDLPNFPTCLYYEGKAWNFLANRAKANPQKTFLFINTF